MEAHTLRAVFLGLLLPFLMGAQYKTPNFLVEAPDARLAEQIGKAAETYRHDLAVEWLGKAMPKWSHRCVLTVHVGANLGAGGATTFVFHRGEVSKWRMTIQGSRQRLFDSVLPHEIVHTIFACHFRRPLPRWADEGAATTVEHRDERARHRTMLVEFLRTKRGIPINEMFAMTEYPRDIMPLYAQAYSLAEFLIRGGGKRKFLAFLGDGLESDDWHAALRRHYAISSTGALQTMWLAWVRRGAPLDDTPRFNQPNDRTQFASNPARRERPEPKVLRIPRSPSDSPSPDPATAQALSASGWQRIDSSGTSSSAVATVRPKNGRSGDGLSRVPAANDVGPSRVAAPEPLRTHTAHPQPPQTLGRTYLR